MAITLNIRAGQSSELSTAQVDYNWRTLQVAISALQSAAVSGTVTSVGLSMPSIFSVASSPVTTSGTLTVTFATQTANKVFASATSGGAATPAFRALVAADIPSLAWSKITSGTPTTLAGYGITDAQPLDADLTAIAALSSTGIARRTASNTWTVGTTVTVAEGGTGAITAAAARIALLPSVTGNSLKVLRVNAGETDFELATITGGITTLNTLTGLTQTFATGTSGTDFAVVSSGTTHTFNIPDAGVAARGLVTTGAQTFAGVKTFSSAPLFSSTTATRVLFAGASGVLTDDADLTFITATNTLNTINLAVTTAITSATLVTSGAVTIGGELKSTPQALSGAGAVNLTTLITQVTSTGAGQAGTLADGTNGQVKIITMLVDGGDWILTPTTKTGFTTITFNDAGDGVTLVFNTIQGWTIVGNNGATLA